MNGDPWVPELTGDAITVKRDGRERVLVDGAVDLGEVLAGAERAGQVTMFRFEPPSLSDLFHAAVSDGGDGR